MFSVNVVRRKRLNADKLKGSVQPFLEEAGALVAGRAKRRAPVDQGRLRGSITYQTRRGGSNATGEATANDEIDRPPERDVVNIGSNVDYAPHQEYGTRKMPAQSYLRPALDESRRNVTSIWRKYVREAMSGK